MKNQFLKIKKKRFLIWLWIKLKIHQSKSKEKIISLKKTVAIILASVLMISTLSFASDYFSFDAQLANLLNINGENEHL